MATDARTSAYVWVWLPGATEPMVAGRLDEVADSGLVTFTYGRSYLQRSEAIALFLPDLPLEPTVHYPAAGQVPGPITDASPDAWGRRVIENRNAAKGRTSDLGPVEVLLESGSARVGAGHRTRRLLLRPAWRLRRPCRRLPAQRGRGSGDHRCPGRLDTQAMGRGV